VNAYEVKAGMVSSQYMCDPYLSASEASSSQCGAIQIQLHLTLPFINVRQSYFARY